MADVFDIYGVPFQNYVHKLSRTTKSRISSVNLTTTTGGQSVTMQYWLDKDDQLALQASLRADEEKEGPDPKTHSALKQRNKTEETDPRFMDDATKTEPHPVTEIPVDRVSPCGETSAPSSGSEAWFKKDITTEESNAGDKSSKRLDYWKTCSMDDKAALIGKLLAKWKRGQVSVDDDEKLAAAQS